MPEESELESEKEWDKAFAGSEDVLDKLLDEAKKLNLKEL
jgi:hypothetical protein